MPDMADPAAAQMDGILNLEFAVRSRDRSGIAALAAHRPVERCPVDNDRSLVAVRQRLRQLALARDAFLARSLCSCMQASNAFWSTVQPFSSRISFVRSSGKP